MTGEAIPPAAVSTGDILLTRHHGRVVQVMVNRSLVTPRWTLLDCETGWGERVIIRAACDDTILRIDRCPVTEAGPMGNGRAA